MPRRVLTKAYVEINGVDESKHIRSVTLPFSRAELDAATMGHETDIFEPGRKAFSCSLETLDDFEAGGGFNKRMFDLIDAGTKFVAKIRFNNAAIGATNPEFRFGAFVQARTTGGAHGELAAGPLELVNTEHEVGGVTHTGLTRHVA